MHLCSCLVCYYCARSLIGVEGWGGGGRRISASVPVIGNDYRYMRTLDGGGGGGGGGIQCMHTPDWGRLLLHAYS